MAIGTGLALLGSIGGSLIGGAIKNKGARRSTNARVRGEQAAIAEQRAAREEYFARTQPFVDIGLSAGEQLQALISDPNAGLEQINPVVDILRKQGFEQIQESAAAGGRLGAGGTLKDLTQFNTDLTTTVIPQLQNQRFNQLFNVLGLGQNTAVGQGAATLTTANNISGRESSIGNVKADGITNRTNVLTELLGNFSSIAGGFPSVFGGSSSPSMSGGISTSLGGMF